MKRTFYELVVIVFVIGIFAIAGCSKSELEFTGRLWLKMGDNSIVPTSDIDFYDVSTHMIYFKKKVPYLEKVGFDYGMMSVYVGNDEIYKCPFHPSYSSYMPQGVIISSPPFNKEDIIRIGFIQFLDENNKPTVADPRNDERIIAALKEYGQYHEGLHCKIQSVQVLNGKVVLSFELSNPDTFDYYYLDIDKMGFGLFHYFTNGPTFLDDPPTKHFTHKETIIHPEPWNSWKKEWLTLLKSGESKNISITYNQFDLMPAGKYRMYFEFPGLSYGISQKELTFEGGRIWLGSIGMNKEVTVQ
jgi:hypothetical protein